MKLSRLIVNVYALLIFALFAFGCEQSSRAKSGASAPDATLKDLQSLEDLKKLYNQDKGAPRLILLLSPT